MEMSDISTQEHWIETGAGQLYAKQWRPLDQRQDRLAPIVLFHDSLGCVALWRDFPERLARALGRRVIAYDRLGFGRSSPHPGTLTPSFIHDEASHGFSAVREALHLHQFVAFGHSVGGGMAVGCAATYPGECRGLITESVQAFVEDRTLMGIAAAKEAFALPEQLERLGKHHGDKAAWVLGAWIDTWQSPSFANWNLDEDLRQVRCPVLVVHGENDEYGSTLHPRRIARLVPGEATTLILPDCGHVPHRQFADLCLDAVKSWIAICDRIP